MRIRAADAASFSAPHCIPADRPREEVEAEAQRRIVGTSKSCDHAAWALGKIACTAAIDALAAKLDFEAEPSVIAELRSALAAPERGPPH